MKTSTLFILALVAVLMVLSITPATATPGYMTMINLYGQDTALINLSQWRASGDYPAIISTKPEPSQGGYYDVAINYPAGQYLLVSNAWVMMNDMKVHGVSADPFPDVQPTPTPGTTPSSSSIGEHSSWFDAGQAVIDFYFQYSFILTCLEYVAILLLLVKKIFPNKRGRSKKSRGWF